MAHLGYDSPSGAEIRHIAETATWNTLLLQRPAGQTPANGRSDDHVWVDVGYGLAFEVMANSDTTRAGQYRRAASLTSDNILRWQRPDGSFSITKKKNWFNPALRVGYQHASQVSNDNGSLMFHLAETCISARASAAREVRISCHRACACVPEDGIGSVDGDLYIGRFSADGEGNQIDLDGDPKPDNTFSARCRFVPWKRRTSAEIPNAFVSARLYAVR